MTRIIKGKQLTIGDAKLQPGWHFEVDQYGVVQATAEFVYDGPNGEAPLKGQLKPGHTHPYNEMLVCHRAVHQADLTGKMKAQCEYIGLNTFDALRVVNGRSRVNASVRGATQQEDIQTHPRFVSMAGTQAAPKNNAWTEQDKASGNFSGFPNNPQTRMVELHGVRQYFSPGLSVSGYYITSNRSDIKTLAKANGTVSADGKWAGIQLIPGYLFGEDTEWLSKSVLITTGINEAKQDIINTQVRTKTWLLNAVSAEEYGNMYWKVSYECMLSGDRGWHDNVINGAKYNGIHIYQRDVSDQ
jgi:hypothetical protein